MAATVTHQLRAPNLRHLAIYGSMKPTEGERHEEAVFIASKGAIPGQAKCYDCNLLMMIYSERILQDPPGFLRQFLGRISPTDKKQWGSCHLNFMRRRYIGLLERFAQSERYDCVLQDPDGHPIIDGILGTNDRVLIRKTQRSSAGRDSSIITAGACVLRREDPSGGLHATDDGSEKHRPSSASVQS
ncbi:hypothetical protein VTO42DRAFT_3532 [Malbranchea cinnamomea]